MTMEFRFSVTGTERKALVAAVSGLTGWDAVYMKAPSFAFAVNNYVIDKNGTLVVDERSTCEEIRQLLDGLSAQGFVTDDRLPDDADTEGDTQGEASLPEIAGCMSIQIPINGFTETALTNLERMVESKAELIRKALGADSIPIERTEDRLLFSWLQVDASADEVNACTQFVHALCEQAKKQKRVTAKEKTVDSEKYAFRCFLLRLGFIGAEYAATRKVLLRNLSGDSSFKNGKRKEDAPQTAQNADSGVATETVPSAGIGGDDAHNGDLCGDTGDCGLAEALADAELIYSVNQLFEEDADA